MREREGDKVSVSESESEREMKKKNNKQNQKATTNWIALMQQSSIWETLMKRDPFKCYTTYTYNI